MKFYDFLVIAITVFFCSTFANATEPLCHTPQENGICYYYDENYSSCINYDPINISGVVTKIHSSDILPATSNLPPNYPANNYYQYYYFAEYDSLSRFVHLGYTHSRLSTIPPPTSYDQDSLYGKVIQLEHFQKWTSEASEIDSANSDMMTAVDSFFILVIWNLPLQAGDSLVIHNYLAGLDLSCSNTSGSGAFDGEYTIYPASTTTSLPNEPNSQNHQTPIRYYTVDGKLQTQKPEFVPVVGVKNRQ